MRDVEQSFLLLFSWTKLDVVFVFSVPVKYSQRKEKVGGEIKQESSNK